MSPTSFLTLERGTPVVDRFGRPVGTVGRCLLLDDGGFDGLVVRTEAGDRFVDSPEVRRISDGAVTLGSTRDEVLEPAGDRRMRGVPAARYGRTHVTEDDRDAVIEALKRAYIEDDLVTTDDLAERVVVAHTAEDLDQLEQALAGLDHP